uniref:Elongation factor 1-delta n=1 Tax=Cerebratulus lacteus TaxID=6221 RepID=A0A0G2YN95_CERLA|nr:elongation factor 1-delta [Cerebratulus lacteus]
MANPMMHETIWFDQPKFEKAEAHYQEHLAQTKYGATNSPAAGAVAAPVAATKGASSDLVNEIARARQHIQTSLNTTSGSGDSNKRIDKLEKENEDLRKMINGLCERIKKLELQVCGTPMEQESTDTDDGFVIITEEEAKPAAKAAAPPADESSDDEDLFGSDSDDDEELAKLEAQRKEAAEKAKKNKKAAPVGKSTIIFEVKGYDDETDFKKVEAEIRNIEHQGLRWGEEAKLVPVAYGIQKLLINAIVVDEECSVDFLEETIEEIEDVQSVDIKSFNKI